MARKKRSEWQSTPPLPDDDLDDEDRQFKRDVKGQGTPAEVIAGRRWTSEELVLPEQASDWADQAALELDSVEASKKLRSSEATPLPSDVHEDDINPVSAADGDAATRRLTNPRYLQQAQGVADLVTSGHGFLIRKLGSQFQRILYCEWCGGPIPVEIDPANFPCECGSESDDPERETCQCGECSAYRQALKSGYRGKGRPPKYCSDRHTKDAKNARKKAQRARDNAERLGIELKEAVPLKLESQVEEPEPEPDPVLLEELRRLRAESDNLPPLQGCDEPPEMVAAFRKLLLWEQSSERHRQIPVLGGQMPPGTAWERAHRRVREWWPRRHEG